VNAVILTGFLVFSWADGTQTVEALTPHVFPDPAAYETCSNARLRLDLITNAGYGLVTVHGTCQLLNEPKTAP
jgi:hypothetical protein